MVLEKKNLLKYKDSKIHISMPRYLGMRLENFQFEIVIYIPLKCVGPLWVEN
jgi:hypothetical protein